MIYLLDTNALIALGWAHHEHHSRVFKWFQGLDSFATCPITQLGFLRISMALPGYAADFRSVRAVLERITQHSGHTFFPCEQDVAVLSNDIRGHQQITDQYLAALAASRKAKLATLAKSAFAMSVYSIPTK
ncbi:MAG: PIN domain-containing protein [Limisphaerales bacterium]